MLPIIGLVTSLLPTVASMFAGENSKVAKSVEVVTNIAEKLTGQTGDAAVKAIEADPNLALEFKKAVMADSHFNEEMRYKDRADAREMYKHHHGMQDKVATSIMTYNLPTVAALVLANVAIAIWVPNDYAVAMQGVGTLIGIVINALLKERQDLIGFNFGSSTGSKMKEVKNGL